MIELLNRSCSSKLIEAFSAIRMGKTKDPLPFLPYSELIKWFFSTFLLCRTSYVICIPGLYYAKLACILFSVHLKWNSAGWFYIKWKCQCKLLISSNQNHCIRQPNLNDGTSQFFTFISFLWKLIVLKTLPLTRWSLFFFLLKRTYFDLTEKILTLLALEA